MHLSLHSHGRNLTINVPEEAVRLRNEFAEAMTRQQAAVADLERIADAMTALARTPPLAAPPVRAPAAVQAMDADAQTTGASAAGDPTGLRAEITPAGIMLLWRCDLAADFVIWRRVEAAEPLPEARRIATTRQTSYLDREVPPGVASVSYTVQRSAEGAANCGSTHTTVRLLDLASAA